MSEAPEAGGKAGYRAAISAFLQERLQAKLDKLKPDDPQRDEVIGSFAHDVWLASAAKRVEQIQAVTHSLKPIHPDARGTNLYVEPRTLPSLAELGSHALGERFVGDVVGNAAALDVYKLLKLEVTGRSLLTALLAPLYASSLAHRVWQQIQDDRFSEEAKAARQARHDGLWSDRPVREYPQLAVQQLGGTKPQNISQLNSERRGMNYLLSSLPPQWKVNEQRFPTHADSVFTRYFDTRPLVRQTVKALRHYLESNPNPVKDTRDHRKELVDVLVDEMVAMAAELQHALPPGWTLNDPRFSKLNDDEQTWLDALRAELPEEADFANRWLAMEWPDAIGTRFGNWLNARLEGQLSFSDIEFREWKKELLTDEDGFSQQLRERRKRIRAARKGGQP